MLKAMYRELEFFSHLKELGPTESTEDKDYKSLLSAEEVVAFVAEIPGGCADRDGGRERYRCGI